MDVNPDNPSGGNSGALKKRDATRNIWIIQYKYSEAQLEKRIRLFNAWPQNVADVALDMNGGESVKFSVTFQFDYWTLV